MGVRVTLFFKLTQFIFSKNVEFFFIVAEPPPFAFDNQKVKRGLPWENDIGDGKDVCDGSKPAPYTLTCCDSRFKPHCCIYLSADGHFLLASQTAIRRLLSTVITPIKCCTSKSTGPACGLAKGGVLLHFGIYFFSPE